jgi:quercetin 2,3-dioxygenase
MIRQTPGKIFLSDQRGLIETESLRSYCTFNFDKYFNEYKNPFGNLYLLNEEALRGDEDFTISVEQTSYVIIIPMIGEVKWQAGEAAASVVDVEEVMVNYMPAGSILHIINPYETEAITFLQIRIKAEFIGHSIKSQVYHYNFEQLENNISEIVFVRHPYSSEKAEFKISLGRFNGRKEGVYKLGHQSLFFAHVLSGAFELEGRLMHEKDSIALWNLEGAELEALSNNALILVIEIG